MSLLERTQQCSSQPLGGSNCGGCRLPSGPLWGPKLPIGTGFLLHIEPFGMTPSVTLCAGMITSVAVFKEHVTGLASAPTKKS